MFKTKLVYFGLIFLVMMTLMSCGEDKPKEIISQEEMVGLLLDVYIAEGKITRMSLKRDSSLVVFEEFEKRIFEKHGMDKDRYKRSMVYYYENLEELEKIYEGVLDSLNLREQRLKEPKDAEKDSKQNEDKKVD